MPLSSKLIGYYDLCSTAHKLVQRFLGEMIFVLSMNLTPHYRLFQFENKIKGDLGNYVDRSRCSPTLRCTLMYISDVVGATTKGGLGPLRSKFNLKIYSDFAMAFSSIIAKLMFHSERIFTVSLR